VLVHRVSRSFLAIGALMALEAAGSALFHGRGGDVAQAVHDLPLIGFTGFVVGWHLAHLLRPRRWVASRWALVATGVALVVGGAAWVIEPTSVSALLGVGIVIVVITDVLTRRRRGATPWSWPTLALLAIAGVAWVLGRSNSPLCDPASILQWHGLWHITSALVLAAWTAAAASIECQQGDPRLARPVIDRGLGLLAALMVRAFFHSVRVLGREHLLTGRPTLVVSNHGNGFVDPMIIASVLGRLPRFIAKAALWKVVPARVGLAFAGVLPVYRSGDGDRTESNDRTFEACHVELARGSTVAIFPEGTTGDRGGLDRVRSGAARIALGSLPGAPDLVILPVGIAYESRIATRSRAVVMVGEPLAVRDWSTAHHLGNVDQRDHAPAEALTEEIRARLSAIAPEFRSRDDRDLLRAVARTVLRAEGRDGSFADAEVVARRLGAADEASVAEVRSVFNDYATRLQLLDLRDDDLERRPPSWVRLALTAIAVALVAPLLVFAALVHLPAVAVTIGATISVRSTSTKGTVRMLVGLATLLATWIIVGAVVAHRWMVPVVAAVTAACGAAALAVVTPWWRAARGAWAAFRVRDREGLLPPVLAARTEVVHTARRIIGPNP
jgi:glycerol-3-phosphate O-acyltransferase / dihydroxyacetone phosphate acyltransferase